MMHEQPMDGLDLTTTSTGRRGRSLSSTRRHDGDSGDKEESEMNSNDDLMTMTKSADITRREDNEVYEEVPSTIQFLELNSIQLDEAATSDSSLPEIDSNTNGTTAPVITSNNNHDNGNHGNSPHCLVNNNHQQIPTNTPPPMMEVKQINMDGVPVHLSGVSLSGSGLKLFVKMDETLGKALHSKPNVLHSTKIRKTRKKMTRTRKQKVFPDFYTNDRVAKVKDQELATLKIGVGEKDSPEEDDKKGKDAEIAENMDFTKMTPVTPQSRTPNNVTPHILGCNQNFQPTSPKKPSNVISGPTWNVENGQIDVIKSQDNLPSSSRYIAPQTKPIDYNTPLDYSMNPFPGGFKSADLPLKRRFPVSRWHRQGSTSPCLPKRKATCRASCSFLSSDFDDDDNEDVNMKYFNDINDLTKKDARQDDEDERQNETLTRNVCKKAKSQLKSEAETAHDSMLPTLKQKASETSHSALSSIKPQLNTELFIPPVDTEAFVKFNQYTKDLRKDLKQQYKNIRQLIKSFDESVQQKYNSKEAEQAESSTKSCDGRCRIM